MTIRVDAPHSQCTSQPSYHQRQRDPNRPLITVVVPVYNEEACLPSLYERLSAVLQKLEQPYEILFVDDGSRDRSLEIIRQLAAEDPHISYVAFSRNFGHEAATTCGIQHAQGQTVVLIDADLQDPPELIPQMLALWEAGYDHIHAQRSARLGETWVTKLTAHLFYRVFRWLAGFEIPVDTGDYRLMDRRVVEAFCQLPERNRFVRGLVSWTGFRQTTILYTRQPRHAGRTKYNFFKRLHLALDAITSMSMAPLRGIGYLGMGIMFLGLLCGLASAFLRLTGLSSVGAHWFLLYALMFVGGLQVATLGLLGEYVGRIYREVQAKPLYIPAEIHQASLCFRKANSVGSVGILPLSGGSGTATPVSHKIGINPPSSEVSL
ncbi:MAG: glycosyltransferase family 2 protein [Thermoguttaceae bacterium]|nr:glycosyltransferase family 2 protein [Thermoguttaceae bacterium]MDW8038587.1 glycosyltransferase family 2 protein [Thermoguttaceae bacterium]